MTDSVQRLRRVRLSDQAAGELKRLIANGTYRSGARLPTEVELASTLGVTRLTVREALSHLEAAGLTTTRHGSGTYVSDFESRATLEGLSTLLGAGRRLSPKECEGVMEFRAIVIQGFADAMATNAQPAHVRELERIVDAARERAGKRGSAEPLAELDYAFNEVLASASGNLFYTLLMRSMRAVHLQLGALIFSELKDDALIIATLGSIADALATGRAPKLKKSLAAYTGGGTAIVHRWADRALASKKS